MRSGASTSTRTSGDGFGASVEANGGPHDVPGPLFGTSGAKPSATLGESAGEGEMRVIPKKLIFCPPEGISDTSQNEGFLSAFDVPGGTLTCPSAKASSQDDVPERTLTCRPAVLFAAAVTARACLAPAGRNRPPQHPLAAKSVNHQLRTDLAMLMLRALAGAIHARG